MRGPPRRRRTVKHLLSRGRSSGREFGGVVGCCLGWNIGRRRGERAEARRRSSPARWSRPRRGREDDRKETDGCRGGREERELPSRERVLRML